MMRSLFSAVSGLRNHQTRMDVIGNNIANVNTVGFKYSRTIFQDVYSQTTRAASGPIGALGGSNPNQIGLGMSVQSIDVITTRSAAENNGNPLDVMIEGEGYFVIHDGQGVEFYTRAGNFYLDKNGNLVTSSGMHVMGSNGPTTPNFSEPLKELTIDMDLYYDVAINDKGEIVGLQRSDGESVTIGYLAIATFMNPEGLEKKGQNLYAMSKNSGDPGYSQAGQNGAGMLNPGSLEMSNVDLSREFTDMIITQRGFQANSRIITVSDQMLEELVNLKR